MRYDILAARYARDRDSLAKGDFSYDKAYFDVLLLEQQSRIDGHAGFFRKYLSLIQEPLLDFGCGTGDFLLASQQAGIRHAVGVDIASDALEICRRYGLQQLVAYDGSGRLQTLESGTIGTIYSSQVIEHIPREQADRLLGEFYRILKPGGRMFLFFPAEKSETYNPDPTHVNFYRIDDFLQHIRSLGFTVEKFWSRIFFPPFDKYIMQIDGFLGARFPLLNGAISAARKHTYALLKRWFTATPGTQVNVIAVKK